MSGRAQCEIVAREIADGADQREAETRNTAAFIGQRFVFDQPFAKQDRAGAIVTGLVNDPVGP